MVVIHFVMININIDRFGLINIYFYLLILTLWGFVLWNVWTDVIILWLTKDYFGEVLLNQFLLV